MVAGFTGLSVEDLAILACTLVAAIFGVAAFACLSTSIFLQKRRSREEVMLELSDAKTTQDNTHPKSWHLRNLRRAFLASLLVSVVFVELLILASVTYDRLHIAAGIILMFLVGSITLLYFAPGDTHQHSSRGWKTVQLAVVSKVKRSPLKVFTGLFALLVVVLILNIALEGMCEDGLVVIDTRIMRRYMASTCPPGPPCHVYLTLPEDPSTSIIVNHHTSPPASQAKAPFTRVYYDTVSHSNGSTPLYYRWVSQGRSFRMGPPSLEVTRDVSWTHLVGLTPDTTYYFITGPGYDEQGNEVWSAERKFRTLHSDDSQYTFVAGGDMDVSPSTETLTTVASLQGPAFGLLGGDLAYENAQATCYRRVDLWLSNWQARMVTPDGYTIPMIAAIGNHEVYGDFGSSPGKVPFFLRYFPQMAAVDDESVTAVGDGESVPVSVVDQRLPYHKHMIGNNTLLLVLDSGHVAEPGGAQAQWISTQMSSHPLIPLKFATYHVPLYPTVRSFDSSGSVAVREAWLGLFDAHQLTIAFENHDHAFKRTHRLRNNEIDPNGTLYIGDGCWGVEPRSLTEGLRWYQAETRAIKHVIRVDVHPDLVMLSSIDEQAAVFDVYNMTIT